MGVGVVEWPTVIDTVERDRLVDAARSRRARVQLIRGPSGIGKSTLAASVASALEVTGYTVLRVVGMPELRDVPLGAMTPLLGSTGLPDDASTTDRLQRLFASVSPSASRHVLLVDDSQMLDEVSASTIYQLVRVYGVACVMTARTEHPLEGALGRLQHEGALDVTEVAPLPAAVAMDMVRSALGGPVELTSLRALVELAAGNALFLRELVIAALQHDAVRSDHAGFVVDATSLPVHLRDTVALRFTGLRTDDRDLAELIAAAEPWPRELLPTAGLDALDRAGLITRSADDTVQLSHPLFAETLLGALTTQQLAARRTQSAALLSTSPRDDHRFTALCLLAETPSVPPPADLAWAAAYAHRVDDQSLAIHLATRAIETALDQGVVAPFDARVVLADALAVSSQFAEADAAFEAATSAATSDADAANVATRCGFYLAVRRQRPRDAVEMGTRAVATMTDPAARDYLLANLAKWRLMLGETPELASTVDDPVNTVNTELFRMMAAVLGSDLETSRRAIAFARPRADAVTSVIRHAGEMIDFADFLVLALEGRTADAVAYGRGQRSDMFDESVGMWNFGLALLAVHQGEVEAAYALAQDAVEQLVWRDFLGVRGAAIALKATAAAQLGRYSEAAEILGTLDEDSRAYLVTELQAVEAEAWALALSGDVASALSVIDETVERGIAGRCYLLSAFTAYVAVRLGEGDSQLEHLRTIGHQTTGELIAALVAHAEALAAQDPDALLIAAGRAARAGLLAGAADAAAQAASFFRASGRDRPARRAWLLSSQWRRGLSGASASAQLEVELSEREWAIASAAAGRERSKEIAERLGLSARTVDNHLTNIYRKLGVSGRDELRRELESLRK